MPDQLLNLLKLFLLLLLYLFFLRVLRAVWTEVNPPKLVEAPPKPKRERARRSTGTRKQGPLALRIIAPAELKGRSYPLGDEITVGRAAGCQVTIDDTYASQVHARIFMRDDQLYVEDLGSTNGTYLNRRKVSAPMVVSHGDQIQIGSTVMEVT